MKVADFLFDPARQLPNAVELEWPLAFIDLDSCREEVFAGPLPPIPLVGLGDGAHPLAALLDCVVEPPVSAETLLRQVAQSPHAAAVAVHLLRSTEGLATDRALTLESLAYGLLQGSSEHRAWLDARAGSGTPLPAGKVLVERENERLTIILDRSEALNAIDQPMRDQLFDAFTIAAIDEGIRSIILRANGAAFSIGGDLAEFGTSGDPATAHLIRSRTLPALAVARTAERLDAHVQGPCVGAGLEIAAFARKLTAHSSAWFQLPELSMGVIPGAGGCVSVPRRIGRQRAALMILSGRRFSAATALRWGLIDSIEDRPAGDEGGADPF